MKQAKRESIQERAEKLSEACVTAFEAAGQQLARRYYEGVDRLREEGRVEGYVKLHFRARMRSNTLELAWVNKHMGKGKTGFESIKKPRGNRDYNLSVLKAQGVEGLEDLIEEIETQARLLRDANTKAVEARYAMEVVQNRLAALHPSLVKAINDAAAGRGPTSGTDIHSSQAPLALDIESL